MNNLPRLTEVTSFAIIRQIIMHAYLIQGREPDKINSEVKLIAKPQSNLLEFKLEKIEDVRALESFVKLSTDNATVIIKNIENASLPAANALLKSLEEPHQGITYILTCGSVHQCLPTIVSRCQVIKLKETLSLSKNETETLKEFFAMKQEEKLVFLEKYKNRENAINFLQNLIIFLHKNLLKTNELKTARYLKSAQKYLKAIKKNANPGLQLTAFVIYAEQNNI
jgi:DNA polymerase III delta prime subunit